MKDDDSHGQRHSEKRNHGIDDDRNMISVMRCMAAGRGHHQNGQHPVSAWVTTVRVSGRAVVNTIS